MRITSFSGQVLCFVLIAMLCFGCMTTDHKEKNKSSNGLYKEEKMYPYEGLFMAKQFPIADNDIEVRQRVLAQLSREQIENSRTEGEWEVQGPGNIGARINTVAVSPHDENIILVGFSMGGVWRTLDGGANWEPIFDDQPFSSIGDVVFDPSDENTLYVGTGDLNIGGYYTIGDGLYKSTDLGQTWENIGLKESKIISKIYVSPSNANSILVSTMGAPYMRSPERGLYATKDGGTTWEPVFQIDDETGVIDFVIDPTDENIIYAAGWTRIRNNRESIVNGENAGLYKSADGGQSWTKLTGGLPEGVVGRVGVCMSPTNTNILYSLFVSSQNQNIQGVFRTDDGGDTWEEWVSNDGDFPFALGGFGWYFGALEVDPFNNDKVFVLGVDLWSMERTDSIEVRRETPPWWVYSVHADKHDMLFVNDKTYLATDGGLYAAPYTNDTDEIQWEDVENIPTTQFYRVAYNPHNPDFYIGGAQDNGTTGGNDFTINEWERIYGGDGFQPAFYNQADSVMFVETQNGGLAYSTDYGFNFNGATSGLQGKRHWDMQYMVSPHDDNVMYTATDQVYKSEGLPPNWVPISDIIVNDTTDFFLHTATCLDQSKADKDLIYVGTSDGYVWATTDEGESWSEIRDGLPVRYVSSIKASPNNEDVVFVTYSGYRDGDFVPRIYKSFDKGVTWQSISGDLPDVAINDVYIYENRSNDEILFVGTDAGVYFTEDEGQSWVRMGENMSNVMVLDIDYNRAKNQLVTATFGRSIMTFDLDQLGIVLEPSSTEEPEVSILNIYPNPSTEILQISLGDVVDQVSIYSISGILVHQERLSGKEKNVEVDVSDLRSGVYIIQVNDKKEKIEIIR